jgi:hypothetical protein
MSFATFISSIKKGLFVMHRVSYAFLWKLVPELICLAIGLIFLAKISNDLFGSISLYTNAGIVISVSLSALCFNYCRALNDDSENRDLVMFAAERFLHACICLVLAGILNYFVSYVLDPKEIHIVDLLALEKKTNSTLVLFFFNLCVSF